MEHGETATATTTGAAVVDDFLEHYGVKGMKWGKRKERSVTISTKDGSSKLKTSGGSGRSATAEAKKTAVTKQVGKKSGTNALTNKQLADAVKRMQLEKQYKELAGNTSALARGRALFKTVSTTGNDAQQAYKAGKQIQALVSAST